MRNKEKEREREKGGCKSHWHFECIKLVKQVDELKERCNSKLNIIKYLSNWDLKPKTLGGLARHRQINK
ncbi:hypothetical protein BpHYR1_026527 [Brachionus plicatilis]|uniref:Uncharacterized protein n=1 Tax=Brachionus plicatilis TaxID=10195 RepID=A0A3M7QTP3_BRAPC|nr:hypothetical protein BpHYR1_026527 [Brachionus plicatilis]